MLLRKSILISVLTLLSRVFGYGREILMAVVLGAGATANAFHIAFRFANVFRSFLAEGAFTSSFVPVYSKLIAGDKNKEANLYASETLTLLTITAVTITVICEIFMPQIMYVLAPGFTDDKELLNQVVLLARINMPYLLFMCISALFGGVLGVFGSFSAVAISPLILNICMIMALIFHTGDKLLTAQILSFSIVISGILQFILIYYQCAKLKVGIKFKQFKLDNNTKTFLKAFFPGVMASSVTQINLWVSTSLATYYDGLVSYLYYADRVLQLPLALIGASVSVVLLPMLSKMTVSEPEKINNTLKETLNITMFMTLPIVAITVFLNFDIISFMFEYGAFTSNDAEKTGIILMIMIFALPAYIINKIITPRFFAIHDTKSPFKAACLALVVNLLINTLFRHFYPIYWSIPVATFISSWMNILVLIIFMKRKNISFALDINTLTKILLLVLFIAAAASLLSSVNLFTIKQVDLPAKLLILITIYLSISHFTRLYRINDLKRNLKK